MLTYLISRLSSSLRTRTQLGFLHQNAPCISYSFSSHGKSSQSEQNQEGNQSLTISYLMNSCGISAEDARKVSKRIELKDPDKPNSILNLLRSYGFSDLQISKIVTCYPRVLLANPEHNLLPKLRFIQSIGFSASEIPELFCFNPTLVRRSLEKCTIPHYKALKSVLDDDWKVRKCLKCSTWSICSYDVKNIVPNINILRDGGVPESLIFYLLSSRANVAFINQSMFGEHVKFVKETGIEPFKRVFVEALVVVTQLSKSTWERKLDFFERIGWSRDVTLSAFCKFPWVMGLSEEKVTNSMKFFVDEVGLRLEDIARLPAILGYSLKRRVIPRWSVVKTLKMKGLIKPTISIRSMFFISEEKFLENFVIKFQDNVPQLRKLYRGELGSLPEVQA